MEDEITKLEELNNKKKEFIDLQDEKIGKRDIELKTLEQTIRQLELEK